MSIIIGDFGLGHVRDEWAHPEFGGVQKQGDPLCRVGIAFERSRMPNAALGRALPTAKVSVAG